MLQLELAAHAHAPPRDDTDDTSAGVAHALIRCCGCRELSPDGLDALRAIAARLSPPDWADVPRRARQHGLGPLVFTHLARAGVLARVPAQVVAELRSEYCAALVTNRRLEIERDKLLAALAARGIVVLMLKGVTLAARYYHEIALRPSGDIDLLVRREQLGPCLRVLRERGYLPKARKGSHLDFAVLLSGELDYRNTGGVRVEPHLELAHAPAYRSALAVNQVWARALTMDIGGVAARYLHPWDELCYLSAHYSVPHQASRLIWLVDIAELVRAQASDWDWDGFVRDTINRGLAMPVLIALQHARDQLGLELPPSVFPPLRAAAATACEQRAWSEAHASVSDLGYLRRQILSLPTLPEKLALVWWAALVSGRGALRQLGRALGAHWRRGGRTVHTGSASAASVSVRGNKWDSTNVPGGRASER